jgi:hypothetical protein
MAFFDDGQTPWAPITEADDADYRNALAAAHAHGRLTGVRATLDQIAAQKAADAAAAQKASLATGLSLSPVDPNAPLVPQIRALKTAISAPLNDAATDIAQPDAVGARSRDDQPIATTGLTRTALKALSAAATPFEHPVQSVAGLANMAVVQPVATAEHSALGLMNLAAARTPDEKAMAYQVLNEPEMRNDRIATAGMLAAGPIGDLAGGATLSGARALLAREGASPLAEHTAEVIARGAAGTVKHGVGGAVVGAGFDSENRGRGALIGGGLGILANELHGMQRGRPLPPMREMDGPRLLQSGIEPTAGEYPPGPDYENGGNAQVPAVSTARQDVSVPGDPIVRPNVPAAPSLAAQAVRAQMADLARSSLPASSQVASTGSVPTPPPAPGDFPILKDAGPYAAPASMTPDEWDARAADGKPTVTPASVNQAIDAVKADPSPPTVAAKVKAIDALGLGDTFLQYSDKLRAESPDAPVHASVEAAAQDILDNHTALTKLGYSPSAAVEAIKSAPDQLGGVEQSPLLHGLVKYPEQQLAEDGLTGERPPRLTGEDASAALASVGQPAGGGVADYGGNHRPPGQEEGAPLHDLTGGGNVYPEDVYGPHAVQHYGTGDPAMDQTSFSIARSAKGRPGAPVTIYRAIPKVSSRSETITALEADKRRMMKHGSEPGEYERVHAALEHQRALPDEESGPPRHAINPGDWVTTNRAYAKGHGESTLRGNYRIISKRVRASEVFTNGDSIHEYGYWPKGTEPASGTPPSSVLHDQPPAYSTHPAPLSLGDRAPTSGPVAAGSAAAQGAIGDESRVSTRVPSAKRAQEDALRDNLSVGLSSFTADPTTLAKNVAIIRKYPNIKVRANAPASTVVNSLLDHAVENLLWLHDQVPSNIRDQSKLWYVGARKIADGWSAQYGITPAQAAAILAVQSPQKDWFQNVDLAKRIITIAREQQHTPWTAEMERVARDKVFRASSTLIQKRKLAAGTMTREEIAADVAAKQAMLDRARAKLGGRMLSQITDPTQRAQWVRVFDEAHNPREYPIITPEGASSTPALTGKGAPQRIAWGGFPGIAKALILLEDGSPATVSAMLGNEHKVRSFYNNIIAPDSEHGDVTIDTHAVAAALLRPLSGGSAEVKQNFGGGGSSSSAIHGSQGTYGLYAEAYRRAAAKRELLAREMQSITWEAVRGLFSAGWKRPENIRAVDSLWREYSNGRRTLDSTRAAILHLAGGISSPEWSGPDTGVHAADASAYDAGVVPDAGRDGGASWSGGRGADPEAVQSLAEPGAAYDTAPPKNPPRVLNVEVHTNHDMNMSRLNEIPLDEQEDIVHSLVLHVGQEILKSEGVKGGRVESAQGMWFKEGIIQPQASIAVHLPAGVSEKQALRISARISIAMKQSELYMITPKVGGGGYALALDFGRALTDPEFAGIMEHLAQSRGEAPLWGGATRTTSVNGNTVATIGFDAGITHKQFAQEANRLQDTTHAQGFAGGRSEAFEARIASHKSSSFDRLARVPGGNPAHSRADRGAADAFARAAHEVADRANAQKYAPPNAPTPLVPIPAVQMVESGKVYHGASHMEAQGAAKGAGEDVYPDSSKPQGQQDATRDAYLAVHPETGARHFVSRSEGEAILRHNADPSLRKLAEDNVTEDGNPRGFLRSEEMRGPALKRAIANLPEHSLEQGAPVEPMPDPAELALHDDSPGYDTTPGTPTAPPAFYSRIERRIASFPSSRGTVEQWAAHLMRDGKRDEMEWTGVGDKLRPAFDYIDAQRKSESAAGALKAAITKQARGEATAAEVSTAQKAADDAKESLKSVADETAEGRREMLTKPEIAKTFDENKIELETVNVGEPGPDTAQAIARAAGARDKVYHEIKANLDTLTNWKEKGLPDRALVYMVQHNERLPDTYSQAARDAVNEGIRLKREGQLADRAYMDAQVRQNEATKYGEYTMPGGEGYSEHLIRLKPKDGASQSEVTNNHWPQHTNILAHFRFKTRMIDGEKVLHVEEVQSDPHERGRKDGYATKQDLAKLKAAQAAADAGHEVYRSYRALPFSEQSPVKETAALQAMWKPGKALDALKRKIGTGAPDMPFKATEDWAMLVAKHVIDHAVKNGYERVAWTPGEIQGDRYDLSQGMDEVAYNPITSELNIAKDDALSHSGIYDRRALDDVIGKDTADKLLAQPLTESDWAHGQVHVLSGKDLKIPPKGMIEFYNKMLPKALTSYAKKAGVDLSLGRSAIPQDGDVLTSTINGQEPMLDDVEEMMHSTPESNLHDAYVSLVESMKDGKTFTEAMKWADERAAIMRDMRVAKTKAPDVQIPSFAITPSLKNLVNTKGQFLMDEPGAQPPPSAEEHKKNNTLVGQALLRKEAGVVAFGGEGKMATVERAVARVKRRISSAKLPSVGTRTAEVRAHESLPFVNLRGVVLSDPVAAAMAMSTQRSPLMEHLSVMHLGDMPNGGTGLGEVMLHTRESSGALNFVRFDEATLDQIVADAKRVGTSAVLLGHNHPSGLAVPSKADIEVTVSAAEYLARRGIAVMGQVVIDHDEFGWINHDGSHIPRVGFDRQDESKYTTAVASGRPQLRDAKDAAKLIGKISDSAAMAVLLLDTQYQVIAATARPPEDVGTIGEWAQGLLEATGAQKLMLALPAHGVTKLMGKIREARAGSGPNWTDDLLDVFHVTPDGDARSLAAAGGFKISGGKVRSFDRAKQGQPTRRMMDENQSGRRAIVR